MPDANGVCQPFEIYAFSRAAGFSSDQAVTMTAIAMAESGGRSGAHNAQGEDSHGLWQINLDAWRDQPWANELDLGNPRDNAVAAWEVSGGGETISPWTVTHLSRDAPYTRYVEEARAAARMFGEHGQGNFDGPPGYGVTVSAGVAGEGDASSDLGTFLQVARAQAGDRYEWGVQTDPSDPDPDAFDCAELVEWAAAQVGIEMGDVSYLQYQQVQDAGLGISVEQAIRTPGALLFRFSGDKDASGFPASRHVAISLGDGTTIEAMGTKWGVLEADATGRGWTAGGLIPGLDYEGGLGPDFDTISEAILSGSFDEASMPTMPATGSIEPLAVGGSDTDQGMLPDAYETTYGLRPDEPDTDGDGITDFYELIMIGSDPELADSDFDQIEDGLELMLGLDPTVFDNPNLVVSPAAPDDLLTDTDGDGLADWGELLGGTAPDDIDTNAFSDADGLALRTDPLIPDA